MNVYVNEAASGLYTPARVLQVSHGYKLTIIWYYRRAEARSLRVNTQRWPQRARYLLSDHCQTIEANDLNDVVEDGWTVCSTHKLIVMGPNKGVIESRERQVAALRA